MDEQEREISLSKKGLELASDPRIQKILDDIERCNEYYPWVELAGRVSPHEFIRSADGAIDEFVSSEEFKYLHHSEQESVIESAKLLHDQNGRHWTIEPSENGLQKQNKIQAIGADVLLVCGITYSDIVRSSMESIRLAQELGFKRDIDMANFVGACILASKSETRINRSFSDFSVGMSDGIETILGVGGDTHSDLRILCKQQYGGKSTDPVGNVVEYMPAGTEFEIGASDKQECSMLVSILKHMFKMGMTEDQQKAVILSVADRFNQVDDGNRGSGLTADYGDAYGTHVSDIQNYKKIGRADFEKANPLCGRIYYGYTMDRQYLGFVTSGDELIIRYYDSSDDTPSDDREIIVKSEYLPDLIYSLLIAAKRGLVRTSPEQLMEILQARFNVSW